MGTSTSGRTSGSFEAGLPGIPNADAVGELVAALTFTRIRLVTEIARRLDSWDGGVRMLAGWPGHVRARDVEVIPALGRLDAARCWIAKLGHGCLLLD